MNVHWGSPNLFVPAVKKGRSTKLASLWQGSYTVVDKTSPVNQLIGGTKTAIVHHNRLKLCFEEPEGRKTCYGITTVQVWLCKGEDKSTTTGETIQVGYQVYLFVPAVKKGRSTKLASLWQGSYTVVDKTSPVNQLIGGTKTAIVHHNRLKLCFEEPEGRKTCYGQRSQRQGPTPQCQAEAREPNAGYTSSGRDLLAHAPVNPAADMPRPDHEDIQVPQRPRRNWVPPDRYGTFISH